MTDHVTQPTAALLAGVWERETTFCYWLNELGEWQLALSHYGAKDNEWLPAPSIGELRERLTNKDFFRYWAANKTDWHDTGLIDIQKRELWILKVTASADALATVWLWVKGKEKRNGNGN
jgi:hypothetical protein